ncbi:MAG: hypothetical protein ISS59_01030 [Desulfobacteraceae bacterium]|nr:hypothetical protein [Desulfobacteraceae bacterium]
MKCEKAGIHLWVNPNGSLGFEGPQQAIEDLSSELKSQKQKIIDLLFDYDAEMDAAIADLNQAGISLMDVPEDVRHNTFLMEQEITRASQDKDHHHYVRIIGEWKTAILQHQIEVGT